MQPIYGSISKDSARDGRRHGCGLGCSTASFDSASGDRLTRLQCCPVHVEKQHWWVGNFASRTACRRYGTCLASLRNASSLIFSLRGKGSCQPLLKANPATIHSSPGRRSKQ